MNVPHKWVSYKFSLGVARAPWPPSTLMGTRVVAGVLYRVYWVGLKRSELLVEAGR